LAACKSIIKFPFTLPSRTIARVVNMFKSSLVAVPAFIFFYVLRAKAQSAILHAESQVYRLLDEIPYEQLPEKMQPDPTQDPVFAMSIEPFNSSSSQPVAVSYPNRSNLSPGTNMPLTSLNPVLGMMVNYGTGTITGDGTQVLPDFDPAHQGHRYGISHFDWHFCLPTAQNQTNPTPDPKVPKKGDPVDPASGLLVVTKTDIAFGGARGQVADPGEHGVVGEQRVNHPRRPRHQPLLGLPDLLMHQRQPTVVVPIAQGVEEQVGVEGHRARCGVPAVGHLAGGERALVRT